MNSLLALRGHETNAFFKQWAGIMLMPQIDRAHKYYLTFEIWEETHLREIFYGTLIFQQSSMICIGRHVGGHTLALQQFKCNGRKTEVIHNFKNHILVTWPATNLLILRKWCGSKNQITIILRYDPLIVFRRQNHHDVTWLLSANGLLCQKYRFPRIKKKSAPEWEPIAAN